MNIPKSICSIISEKANINVEWHDMNQMCYPYRGLLADMGIYDQVSDVERLSGVGFLSTESLSNNNIFANLSKKAKTRAKDMKKGRNADLKLRQSRGSIQVQAGP